MQSLFVLTKHLVPKIYSSLSLSKVHSSWSKDMRQNMFISPLQCPVSAQYILTKCYWLLFYRLACSFSLEIELSPSTGLKWRNMIKPARGVLAQPPCGCLVSWAPAETSWLPSIPVCGLSIPCMVSESPVPQDQLRPCSPVFRGPRSHRAERASSFICKNTGFRISFHGMDIFCC